jgi:hypothetical protein
MLGEELLFQLLHRYIGIMETSSLHTVGFREAIACSIRTPQTAS